VPRPTNDITAPELTWRVTDRQTGKQVELHAHSEYVTSATFGQYDVVLVGFDPEGVRQLELGSFAGWSCTSGAVAQSKTRHDAPAVSDLRPVDGKVLTSFPLLRSVNLDAFACPATWVGQGKYVKFSGTVRNYSDGTTAGELLFRVRDFPAITPK
jgi:hypothetical protein